MIKIAEGIYALSPDEVENYYSTYYDANDKGHGRYHVQAVSDRMAELVGAQGYKDTQLADIAALTHDVGISSGRDAHEIHGSEIVAADPLLQQKLSMRRMRLLVNAVRQHRASTGKPRSMLGKLLSDADRLSGATAGDRLRRAYEYGKVHIPDLDDEQQLLRAAEHVSGKYGPGGYGIKATYFPDTHKQLSNAVQPIIQAHESKDLKALKDLL